jgi:hypothetical protein
MKSGKRGEKIWPSINLAEDLGEMMVAVEAAEVFSGRCSRVTGPALIAGQK